MSRVLYDMFGVDILRIDFMKIYFFRACVWKIGKSYEPMFRIILLEKSVIENEFKEPV